MTVLHIKVTDHHQYLHYTSSHRHHTKRSIAYSQALKISRTWSFQEKFKRHRNQMKLRFLNRGYPKRLINTEVEKVKFSSTFRERDAKMRGIPLVIIYHPLVNILLVWLERIFIFSIWKKKLKKSLLLVLWFHSKGQEKRETISLEQNCTI